MCYVDLASKCRPTYVLRYFAKCTSANKWAPKAYKNIHIYLKVNKIYNITLFGPLTLYVISDKEYFWSVCLMSYVRYKRKP